MKDNLQTVDTLANLELFRWIGMTYDRIGNEWKVVKNL